MSHSDLAVSVNRLEKRYGTLVALAGVSLEVEPGTLFGLLGQNGAGKTTLIKILLGLVAPTAGTASLLGQPVGRLAARREVGYLPEDHRLPEYHTAPSLLHFYGALQGLSRRERLARIPFLLELLGLKGREKLRIRGYSKGMKQRLGLAQSLLHRPRVLFLDEPTDGIDPVGRKQIRDVLLEQQREGVTVFINSHLLGEVEQLCDRVAIMRRGHLLVSGTVAELTPTKPTWLVGFETPPPSDLRWEGCRLEPADRPGLWRVHLDSSLPDSIDRFLAQVHRAGLRLRHLEPERATLEDLYLTLATSERQAS